MQNAEIGIIGGSGLYDIEGIKNKEWIAVHTPFGAPSDQYLVGTLEDRKVAFLPRHGRGHIFLPSEINYRANIYGFKKLGVKWLIAVSAVGSLKEEIKPSDIVVIDQFFDRTGGRSDTFFGDGIAAHISMAEPICPNLADIISRSIKELGATFHNGGTYINMEGPAFSTRAESFTYRKMGFDVIGMTNFSEAKLAREAEICYATMAMVTDYDCWHEEEDNVSVGTIIETLNKNAENAQQIVRRAITKIPPRQDCPCATALRGAIITAPIKITSEAKEKLDLLIGKYLTT